MCIRSDQARTGPFLNYVKNGLLNGLFREESLKICLLKRNNLRRKGNELVSFLNTQHAYGSSLYFPCELLLSC